MNTYLGGHCVADILQGLNLSTRKFEIFLAPFAQNFERVGGSLGDVEMGRCTKWYHVPCRSVSECSKGGRLRERLCNAQNLASMLRDGFMPRRVNGSKSSVSFWARLISISFAFVPNHTMIGQTRGNHSDTKSVLYGQCGFCRIRSVWNRADMKLVQTHQDIDYIYGTVVNDIDYILEEIANVVHICWHYRWRCHNGQHL